MVLELSDTLFSVCKLSSFDGVDFTKPFTFTGVSEKEYSLVCQSLNKPNNVIDAEDGWRLFRLQGSFEFYIVGIIAELTSLLQQAKIPVFVISTFDTDYILLKKEYVDSATEVFKSAGHKIVALK